MANQKTHQLLMIPLSIVIPTYNRAKRLRACLDALCVQTQPASDFEVIVVVDGSTDETVEMLKNYGAPYLLRTVWQENRGQPNALNHGIKEAQGQSCLFIDDDIYAESRLVAEHLQAQRAHPKAVVVGQITLSLSSDAGWYARAFAQGWSDNYDQLNQGNRLITWEDCYSGNMSAPRDLLLECGGFAVDLARGYDIELAKRLENQGCAFVYAPDAIGCQYEQKDFSELSRDAENAGKADVMFYNRDSQMLSDALGSFSQAGWRKLLLRRVLLALHIPPKLLELFGWLIKDPARRHTWFAIIQAYCYWRGVRRIATQTGLWKQLTSGTLIMMYHAIGVSQEAANLFVIKPARFAAQMGWLKKLGYHPISLAEFLTCQRERRFPPARSVVITLDDGYADNYSQAFPILRKINIPATIFLVSGYIGLANRWDADGPLHGRPLMTWSEIEEMAAHGVHFGAHTRTHVRLTAQSSFQMKDEIFGSRMELEDKLHRPLTLFAYPYGEYDPSIQAIVKDAGFMASCTIDTGLNTLITSPLALRRAEVQGTDSWLRFLLVLWLGDGEAFWWRRKKNYQEA
jgi:glycosyltransferase involved in cell wall biosynthesis